MSVYLVSQVEYVTLPGWQSNIENVRDFSQLPPNAQKYVQVIEELLQIRGEILFITFNFI